MQRKIFSELIQIKNILLVVTSDFLVSSFVVLILILISMTYRSIVSLTKNVESSDAHHDTTACHICNKTIYFFGEADEEVEL